MFIVSDSNWFQYSFLLEKSYEPVSTWIDSTKFKWSKKTPSK